MGLLDFILFPLYVYFFHLFFASRRKKITDPVLKFYHKTGFWLKVFSTLAITIFNLYISVGDSITLYFREGLNIYHLILNDPSHLEWIFKPGREFDLSLIADTGNPGYFKSEANYFIIRLVAIFSFFTFGHYLLINLFFSMIAFSGIWRLFLFFYELYPKLHKKIAIAVLFLPTVLFWSSGILKDPISMGMLGWMTYSLYNLVLKKIDQPKNLLIAFISIWILFIVKPYILFAYFPFLMLFLILKNLTFIQSATIKFFIFIFINILSIGMFVIFSENLKEEMGSFSVDTLGESVQSQQENFQNMSEIAESSFSLGVEFDGSIGSLLKIAPAAINATMFRPYIWESKKLSTLLSSIEALCLMFFTLYVIFKSGIWNFFSFIIKDPMILFCFFFSITFALFIGSTTLNFGTLVRYKIPCMPFYVMALVLINEKRIQNKKALLAKKSFVKI